MSRAGVDDVRDLLSSYQAVAVWEIGEVRSIIVWLSRAGVDADRGRRTGEISNLASDICAHVGYSRSYRYASLE